MKADTKLDTKAVANEALGPLIEHCNKTVGSKAELAKKMSEALGYNVHRQIAEGWVHSDPAKRVEPKLGLGLVLLRIGGEMMGVRKPLQIGRVMTKAFKEKPAKRKAKVATNGEAKRQAWADRPRKSLPPSRPTPEGDKAGEDPTAFAGGKTRRIRKPSPMTSADLDAHGSTPARKPKADVRKAIKPATQWPAAPKARKK